MNYSLSNGDEKKAIVFLNDLKGSRSVLSYSDAVSEVRTTFKMSEEEAKEIVNRFIKEK